MARPKTPPRPRTCTTCRYRVVVVVVTPSVDRRKRRRPSTGISDGRGPPSKRFDFRLGNRRTRSRRPRPKTRPGPACRPSRRSTRTRSRRVRLVDGYRVVVVCDTRNRAGCTGKHGLRGLGRDGQRDGASLRLVFLFFFFSTIRDVPLLFLHF